MRRRFARLVNLFRQSRAERELAREIDSHLALLQESFERNGMSPAEAALAARRAYGGIEQAKELHREARSFLWIDEFVRDLRYGWSNLLRSPGFTLTAILALALAIGVNTTLFAIYNAMVLKPLPVADPGRVVRLKRWFEHYTSGNIQYNFAYPEYEYLRDHNSCFDALTLSSFEMPVLASIAGGVPEHLRGHAVSSNYFAAMGVAPLMGRTFLPDEDQSPGGNAVVVLRYDLWQRKYGGDASVVGQILKLNDVAYTIIGVAPKDFGGTDILPTESAFWVPVSMVRQLGPGLDPVLDHWYPASHVGFQMLARVKSGVSIAEAQAETSLLLQRFLQGQHEPERTTSVTLRTPSYFDDETFFTGLRQVSNLGTGLVCLVLLVACANVANMLLARGVTRQREISIRLALGASRARIVRQLLTESVLLALLGGVMGILVSGWAGRFLWLSLSSGFQMFDLHVSELDFSPDAHLISYGAALALLTALLFGLVPALRATRQDLCPGIKDRSRTASSPSRLKQVLLGTQVAAAMLMLSGGSEFASLANIKLSDLGVDTHTYLMNIHDDDLRTTERHVREQLAILPEVSRVAIGGWPLKGDAFRTPMAASGMNRSAVVTYDSDAYFETMGIPIRQGRGFTRAEADHGAAVALISESTAKHYWPRQEALHQHFTLDRGPQIKLKDFEVIGIAGDIRFTDIAANDPSHVFLPLGAAPGDINGGLVFRLHAQKGEALRQALARVQSAVASVDKNLLADMQVMTFEEGPVAMQRDGDHVVLSVVSIVILILLALASVGIYGVAAFLSSQRAKEIGIRIALGATSRNVVRTILAQSFLPVSLGVIAGLAIGAAFDVYDRSQQPFPDTLLHTLFGDPYVYAAFSLLLGIGLLATIVPARRAARIDPVIALRQE